MARWKRPIPTKVRKFCLIMELLNALTQMAKKNLYSLKDLSKQKIKRDKSKFCTRVGFFKDLKRKKQKNYKFTILKIIKFYNWKVDVNLHAATATKRKSLDLSPATQSLILKFVKHAIK